MARPKRITEEEQKAYILRLHDIQARCSTLCTDLGAAGLYDSVERMESVCNTVQAEVALRLTEKATGKTNPEGWVWLSNTSDYHYFRHGKSLCGRWVIPTSPKFSPRDADRAYNCQMCAVLYKKGRKRQ